MVDRQVAVDGPSREELVAAMGNLLKRMLRLDVAVTEHTKLADELGMSSSQGVQLVLDLERDLAIMVDVEDFDQDEVATVGDMADYIAAHSTPE